MFCLCLSGDSASGRGFQPSSRGCRPPRAHARCMHTCVWHAYSYLCVMFVVDLFVLFKQTVYDYYYYYDYYD